MAVCPSPICVPVPEGKGHLFLPCGKCMECLKRRRSDWSFRLKEELRVCDSAYFITLTYSDDNVPSGGTLVKRDLTLFLKRLRKENVRLEYDIEMKLKVNPDGSKPSKMKYYATGEYGENTLRPHYHIIMFNLMPQLLSYCEKIWSKGFIKVGNVTDASIHYVTKYIINSEEFKKDNVEGIVKGPSFCVMSKKLGIEYLRNNWKWHKQGLKDWIISSNGAKQRMPRYYADKVFNFKEKEVINERRIKRMDEVENNEMLKCKKNNVNYFEDKIMNRKQKVFRFNQLNKNDIL